VRGADECEHGEVKDGSSRHHPLIATERNIMKKILSTLVIVVFAIVGLSACTSADDADVVSENISTAADNFEVNRRIVFYNGITDKYMLEVVGRCNIVHDEKESQLEVTCKLGKDEYQKHFLGLSDNVTYFVEQGEPIDVSEYHYRVTFKPQAIIPDPDFRGSSEDTPFEEQ